MFSVIKDRPSRQKSIRVKILQINWQRLLRHNSTICMTCSLLSTSEQCFTAHEIITSLKIYTLSRLFISCIYKFLLILNRNNFFPPKQYQMVDFCNKQAMLSLLSRNSTSV